MKVFSKDKIQPITLPGRQIWKAVGKDAFSESGKITYGFARFSAETGPTTPHHHAEEICYVLDAQKAWVRFGLNEEELGKKIPLESGFSMHIPALEWHQFSFEEDGFLEIIFIYGQVDNIRPEEK